jgi:hypothetical protein
MRSRISRFRLDAVRRAIGSDCRAVHPRCMSKTFDRRAWHRVQRSRPRRDAPLCWTSTRCARLRKARAPTTFCPLIPRLVDATAYVARAAERHVCAASSKCYGSQTVESGKAIRPGMNGFPSAYFRFAMQCGCLNVSMPFGCHLFVSCQAVGSHVLDKSHEEATTASYSPSLN